MTGLSGNDLATLSKLLEGGQISALELLETYIERIELWNPSLNAIRYLDLDRARRQAKLSDARAERLGVLDGVPIVVKDNVDIEGLVTRSGLGPRDETPSFRNANVIRRLREAGAVILGHATMHEAALGGTTDNPHYGRTQNPWRAGYTPGGSSGGSAAAVAAGFCPLAIGTDTMGSIRLPAAYCGVAGYKPGYGVVSNDGVEPLYRAFDQVGPIASSVFGLLAWFKAMTGDKPTGEPLDPKTLRWGRLNPADAIDDDDIHVAFEDTLSLLQIATADISAHISDTAPGRVGRAGLLLIEVEAAVYYAEQRKRYPTTFSQQFAAMLDYGARAEDERITKAKAVIDDARKRIDATFDDVDLLIMPTTPQTAFSFDDPLPTDQVDFTALANITASPAVTLPIGLDRRGLPIGLQIMGKQGADRTVLAAAAAIEPLIGFARPDLPQGDWS